MSSKSVYLIMCRRYDEEASRPKLAFEDQSSALQKCIELTKESHLYKYSVTEVPVESSGFNF